MLLFFLIVNELTLAIEKGIISIKIKNKTINVSDDLNVELKNNSQKLVVFFIISSEKKIDDEWTNYNSDVFTEPMSKSHFPEILKKNENKSYNFKLPDPEIIEMDPNGMIRPVQGNMYKPGIYRLKINYGFHSSHIKKFIYSTNQLNKTIYSDEFTIH